MLTLREEHKLRVCENGVLGRISGRKKEEITGEWRKVHDKELKDMYSSPSIIRVIKSRRMRWERHVERMGKGEEHTMFWWGNLRKMYYFEDAGVNGRLILNYRSEIGGGRDRIDLAQNRNIWLALVNAVMNLRVP